MSHPGAVITPGPTSGRRPARIVVVVASVVVVAAGVAAGLLASGDEVEIGLPTPVPSVEEAWTQDHITRYAHQLERIRLSEAWKDDAITRYLHQLQQSN